ncbi:hypothetical protein AB0877_18045 [Micromonospora sp. NPDC047644]
MAMLHSLGPARRQQEVSQTLGSTGSPVTREGSFVRSDAMNNAD